MCVKISPQLKTTSLFEKTETQTAVSDISDVTAGILKPPEGQKVEL